MCTMPVHLVEEQVLIEESIKSIGGIVTKPCILVKRRVFVFNTL